MTPYCATKYNPSSKRRVSTGKNQGGYKINGVNLNTVSNVLYDNIMLIDLTNLSHSFQNLRLKNGTSTEIT